MATKEGLEAREADCNSASQAQQLVARLLESGFAKERVKEVYAGPKDSMATGADQIRWADGVAGLFGERVMAKDAFDQIESGLSCDFALVLTVDRLELRQTGTDAPGPVFVDFTGGALAHRRRFGGGRGQPLARAVGIKPGYLPTVFDATAGLGRDAFVLATLGCRVTLCERSPVLVALLKDALDRAYPDPEVQPITALLTLRWADALEVLDELQAERRPDVVYLDPMYPPGKASVLVKKEMRAVQRLVGPDRDSATLLEKALATARRRVVVKRPGRADPLNGRRPSTSIQGKKTRYDVYVV